MFLIVKFVTNLHFITRNPHFITNRELFSQKLLKKIPLCAMIFAVQNITAESKEVIYAYGMELLISDVLNTIIVLLIALISHTLPAVVVFIAVFMGLRQFVGGYHANSHLSCMFTLVMVMLVFSYGICNVSGQSAQIFSISFIAIALPVIFCIAPVEHPNKPMSEEKGVKLRKRSIILAVSLSTAVIALLLFQYRKISLYVSSGILLSAIMALLGHFLNRGDNSKR